MLQQAVNGAILGSLYALIATIYSLLFGTLRMVDMAFGERMMASAMCAALSVRWFGGSPWIVLAIACGTSTVLGVTVYLTAVKPLGDYSDPASPAHLATLVTTVATSLLIQGATSLVVGPDEVGFPRIFDTRQRSFGGLQVSPAQVAVVVGAAVVVAAVGLLVYRSRWGLRVRCVADNPAAAQGMGISLDAVRLQVVTLVGALSGLAGVGIGLSDRVVTPYTGLGFGLKALVIVIIGGLGSPLGAALGGMLLGLAEIFAVVYVSESLRDGVAFLLLLGALLARPRGLCSGKVRD